MKIRRYKPWLDNGRLLSLACETVSKSKQTSRRSNSILGVSSLSSSKECSRYATFTSYPTSDLFSIRRSKIFNEKSIFLFKISLPRRSNNAPNFRATPNLHKYRQAEFQFREHTFLGRHARHKHSRSIASSSSCSRYPVVNFPCFT